MKKEYKVQLRKLLTENDRMDLWRYILEEREKPEDPVDYVEILIQEHPEKRERVVNKIDENYAF